MIRSTLFFIKQYEIILSIVKCKKTTRRRTIEQTVKREV